MSEIVAEPIIQYGFLGLSAVLLGIIVWLIRRLLGVLEANNEIIAANTQAIQNQNKTMGDLMALSRSLHDKIISRPCIARGEEG